MYPELMESRVPLLLRNKFFEKVVSRGSCLVWVGHPFLMYQGKRKKVIDWVRGWFGGAEGEVRNTCSSVCVNPLHIEVLVRVPEGPCHSSSEAVSMTPQEFLAKVPAAFVVKFAAADYSGDCWRWVGALTTHGYGKVARDRDRVLLAHVLAYTWVFGPIPAGLELDHVRAWGCVNRDCFRPSHLEAVTHKENCRRGKWARAVFREVWVNVGGARDCTPGGGPCR